MKYFFLSFSVFFTLVSFAQYSGLEDARTLAEKWIIVNQSSAASQSADYVGGNSVSTEPQLYRLNDYIIRQEVLGIALNLKGITLPATYGCRGYFSDAGVAGEWWVCRAAELSADADIVTRANTFFRPRATITLAEALGITIKSLNIFLRHQLQLLRVISLHGKSVSFSLFKKNKYLSMSVIVMVVA